MPQEDKGPFQAFSAPGKVLLAGGYLVLDRDYTGLVFGLDARIHVHIQSLPTSPGVSLSEIIVRSPQFREAEWRYGYRETEADGGFKVTQLKGQTTAQVSRNKFVETALEYALTYAFTLSHKKINPSQITILADSDYYSNTTSKTGDFPAATGRFVDFNVPLNLAHKTGLGSSAALVTAFTTAVVAYYAPPQTLDLTSEACRRHLHNLAQAAHCAAQGKVGSGFDVAAAVYGSCIYRRFSPSVLESLHEVGSEGFSTRLKGVIEDSGPSAKWDMQIDEALAVLPKGLVLLMCDVDCGSETVGMVKNVLAWRAANKQEADLLWATLQQGNEDLAAELQRLSALATGDASTLENLRDIILTNRSLIREMSAKAKVPVEPKVSTDLIDSSCQISGVIGGVVPGAGGYDAIALLVEDRPDTLAELQEFLGKYHVGEADGSQGIGKVQLLGVKQEYQGLRQESSEGYGAWAC